MADMSPSVAAHARETVQSLFAFIDAQGHGDYIGEAVSQRTDAPFLKYTSESATTLF